MTYHAKSDYSGWVNYAKLEKIAEKIRKADPKMTQGKSIAKAAELNPRLKAAYSEEVRRDILKGGR